MGAVVCEFVVRIQVGLGICFCSGYLELEEESWSSSREGMVELYVFYGLGGVY